MRASQRPSRGRVKRGRLEWQQVFKDHRCDRMTDRLIEAVPLHHTANSDPQSVTPVTILFLSPTMKTIPQFVWEASQKTPKLIADPEKNSHMDDNALNNAAVWARTSQAIKKTKHQ